MLKGYCRAIAFLASGFYIALLTKKPAVEGRWDLLIFAILLFCAYYGWKTENVDNLLNGISDDINDIKEKLGLPTSVRTPAQDEKENMKVLYRCINKGDDIREIFSKKKLKKYSVWIKSWIREAGMVKFCPKCQKSFEDVDSNLGGEFSISSREYKWNCDICRGNLILKKKEVVV